VLTILKVPTGQTRLPPRLGHPIYSPSETRPVPYAVACSELPGYRRRSPIPSTHWHTADTSPTVASWRGPPIGSVSFATQGTAKRSEIPSDSNAKDQPRRYLPTILPMGGSRRRASRVRQARFLTTRPGSAPLRLKMLRLTMLQLTMLQLTTTTKLGFKQPKFSTSIHVSND